MSMNIDPKHVEELRASLKIVGPLYPILVDQNDRELSGRHRSQADQAWPRRKIEVEDGFQRELIILMSNKQRTIPHEEVAFRLNRIAMEYWDKYKVPEETVCQALCSLLAPLTGPKTFSQSYIERSLDPRWKAKTVPLTHTPKKVEPSSTSINDKAIMVKKTAMDMQSTGANQDPFPAKDCRCRECPHKTELCGYP